MNEVLVDLVFSYWFPAVLIVVGYLVGSRIERRHFRTIIRRETELRGILAFAFRRPPNDIVLSDPTLVSGSAVISVDYFKRFVAGLRGIIGGRVGAYESLFERARREAILRMKTEAKRHERDIVLNVKLESTRIFAGVGPVTVTVEAMAYGTAYTRNAPPQVH